MTTTETADVVVYRVRYHEDSNEITSWGRGTRAEAENHCRRPNWPAKPTDSFVAVDDWGYSSGTIVAATPDLEWFIGKTLAEFRTAAH